MTLLDEPVKTIPQPFRWTVESYIRAFDSGAFTSERVELVGGEIFVMAPQSNPHTFAVSKIAKILNKQLPEKYLVTTQSTIRLSDSSAPEPDIAVLIDPGNVGNEVNLSPILIIEMSDSSIRYDRGKKASLYASHGIADYWVFDLISKVVSVMRSPIVDSIQEYGWRYGDIKTFSASEVLHLSAIPEVAVEIAKIF